MKHVLTISPLRNRGCMFIVVSPCKTTAIAFQNNPYENVTDLDLFFLSLHKLFVHFSNLTSYLVNLPSVTLSSTHI